MANESSVLVRLRLLGGAAFATAAKGASAGLGSLDAKGGLVQRRMSGVNKVLGKTVAAMKVMGKGAAVAGGVGLAYGIKQSVNFQQAMANVQARLLTTGSNMDKLRQQALDLGAKTQFSAGQAADAMGILAQAGFNTREIMGTLPGTLSLAAASGVDLADAADIQTVALRGFGLAANQAGHVADVLAQTANKTAADVSDMRDSIKYVAPVAHSFNQNMEDMVASIGLLANVGIKGEQAGTTIRRALVQLVKPSKKTIGVMDEAGLSMKTFTKITTTANGKMRPLPGIIGRLAKATDKMGGRTKRKLFAQIFGVEALPGILALMDQGEGKINKLSNALVNSQGSAKRAAGIMRNTVKGAWDNFTGSVETAAITLMTGFQPAMQGALDKAAEFVNVGTKAVGLFAKGFSQGAKPGAAPARTPGQAMAPRDVQNATGAAGVGAQLRAKLQPAIEWAQANLPKLGKAVIEVGRQLVDAFKPAQPFFENVLLPLLKGVAIGVVGSVVAAFKILIPVIKLLMTGLGALGTILKPFRGVFQSIGVVIGFIAAGPILKLLGGLKYVGLAFRLALIPVRIMGAALAVVGRAIGWLVLKWLSLHLAVARFVAGILTAPQRVGGAVVKLVSSIVGKIGTLAGKLIRAGTSAGGKLISGLANGVRSRLGSLVSFFGRVGKSIVDAIVNAIKSAPGALVDAIKSILPGGKLGSKIASFLGLASGGVVSRGGMAIVGERGPELAQLPTGTTVYSNRETNKAARSGMLAGGASFTGHLTVNLSGKQIHQEVFRVERAAIERS